MFRMILFTQWKWSRLILLPAVIAAFALPVFSVQAVGTPNQSGWEARRILSAVQTWGIADRKSTRLNSSHVEISYAVFCLKKKKKEKKNYNFKKKKKKSTKI